MDTVTSSIRIYSVIDRYLPYSQLIQVVQLTGAHSVTAEFRPVQARHIVDFAPEHRGRKGGWKYRLISVTFELYTDFLGKQVKLTEQRYDEAVESE